MKGKNSLYRVGSLYRGLLYRALTVPMFDSEPLISIRTFDHRVFPEFFPYFKHTTRFRYTSRKVVKFVLKILEQIYFGTLFIWQHALKFQLYFLMRHILYV